MRRRLTILAVDAVVLMGLAVVVMALLRLDTTPSRAAEVATDAEVLEVEFAQLSLPTGRVAVSARVVAQRSNDLIMPGDKVDVSRSGAGVPVMRGAEILRIDPPLMEDDERLLVTFSVSTEEASKLRALRSEALLFVRLSSVGTQSGRAGFEPPKPSDVITLRFEDGHWSKRLGSNR